MRVDGMSHDQIVRRFDIRIRGSQVDRQVWNFLLPRGRAEAWGVVRKRVSEPIDVLQLLRVSRLVRLHVVLNIRRTV